MATRLLRDSGPLSLDIGNEKKWRFTHEVFRDYLCAYHVVARADNAVTDWLRSDSVDQWRLRLWRYACGITIDATPLFKAMFEHNSLPTYEKARWLGLAIGDGVNASPTELRHAGKLIVREIERLSDDMPEADLSILERRWRLDISRSGPEVDALGDLVRLVVGGGWKHLAAWIGTLCRRFSVHTGQATVRSTGDNLDRSQGI
jgi:hypothetical protein